MPTLYTIGHSTRAIEIFLAMLQTAGIKTLADVRAVPASRWNPQYNAAQLTQSLHEQGIAYVPMKELGGRRHAVPDSENTGLKEGLRGYADYMRSSAFAAALDKLLSIAAGTPTAVMCAEADPLNCHRQLIADAALMRDWDVHHIILRETVTQNVSHHLSRHAVIEDGYVLYPAPQKALSLGK